MSERNEKPASESTEQFSFNMNESSKTPDTNSKKTGKKKKKRINPLVYWFVLLVAAIAFLVMFFMLPMFPMKWKIIVAAIVAVLVLIMFMLSMHVKKGKGFIKITNLILSAVLLITTALLPFYKAKVSDVVTKAQPDKVMIKMNFYVMSEDYVAAHGDVFGGSIPGRMSDPVEDLKQFANSMFITEISVDYLNQRSAINELKQVIDKEDIAVIDRNSTLEAVRALYRNEGQVLILNEAYTSVARDSDEFENFDKDTRLVYTIEIPEEHIQMVGGNEELTSEPFSVFFGGNDEEGDLSLYGKTDVDMVVTVNPKTHQISIVSFPRDSYVQNPALGYGPDKLTHLGMQGLQNTLYGLENILGVTINNYVLINFTTYKNIIDALGGVDLENPYAFGFWDDENVWFDEGPIHLSGDAALLYVRERKTLPDGDFGRTMHQQLVMKAIIEKMTSLEMITKFDAILTSMRGTFLTNVSDSALYGLCQMQLDENVHWNIVNYRVQGDIGMSQCASSGVQALSVVYPYANQVEFIAGELQKIVNGEVVEQQELPDGWGYLVAGIPGVEEEEYYAPVEETPVEEYVEPTPEPEPEPEPEPTPEPEPEPEQPAEGEGGE